MTETKQNRQVSHFGQAKQTCPIGPQSKSLRFSSISAGIFLVAAAATAASCLSGELDLTDSNIPIVLTPTRLKQSVADVPGSVTIITADMIQKFNIRSVPDALRLVPGMAVDQLSGTNSSINYHGTNISVPRRMNVLVDGMSVYRPLLARVNWEQLPVAMEDILRIEVTRGSNSASYGTNSMLATINIITKQPNDVIGTTLKTTMGARDTVHHMARYGGTLSESTTYRMTLESQKDDGFGTPSYEGPDGTRTQRLQMRAVTEINSSETLDTQLTLAKGRKESEPSTWFDTAFPDSHTEEYYLSTLWRKNMSSNHALQIQAYASQTRVRSRRESSTCLPAVLLLPEMFAMWRANQNYAMTILMGLTPSGGTAQDDALALAAMNAIAALGADQYANVCGHQNKDSVETRKDLEIQDTYVFSDGLRMVNGVVFRQDKAYSKAALGDTVTNNTFKAFNNTEYKPADWLTLNAGGFFEKDQMAGSTFSPRIAANAHASDNHSFRFVLSKGTRSPDIFEQRGQFAAYFTDFSMPVNGATAGYYMFNSKLSGQLERERIRSKEIGYYGNFPKYGLLVDGKVFDDRLTRLISESPDYFSYDITNQNSVRLRGTEWQVNYDPSVRWTLHAGYSYLRNTDSTTPAERSQYSRHSGSLGVSHLFDHGVRGSFVITGAEEYLSGAFATRKDFTLSKTFALPQKSRVTTSLTVRRLDNPSTYSQNYPVPFYRQNRHDVGTQYYFTFKLDL